MRALSAASLLDAWERARTDAPALRAADLLSAVSDEDAAAIAAMSIGERDRRLLAMRERTFGPAVAGVVSCPSCGERGEWQARLADLCVQPAEPTPGELMIAVDGRVIRFRLPNGGDLQAAAAADDPAEARQVLLSRCLLELQGGPEAVTSEGGGLPEPWIAAISARMSEADPQADSSLDLTCAACGHRWTEMFDIDSFFWIELTAWAERTLEEVHTLASAYGWRERDILRMGVWRRQFYLGLIAT